MKRAAPVVHLMAALWWPFVFSKVLNVSNYMLEIHLLQRGFFYHFLWQKSHVRTPERLCKRGRSSWMNETSEGRFLKSFQLLKSFQQFSVEPIGPVVQLYRATFQGIGQQFLRRGCQQTHVHKRVKLEGGGVMWINVSGLENVLSNLLFDVRAKKEERLKTEENNRAGWRTGPVVFLFKYLGLLLDLELIRCPNQCSMPALFSFQIFTSISPKIQPSAVSGNASAIILVWESMLRWKQTLCQLQRRAEPQVLTSLESKNGVMLCKHYIGDISWQRMTPCHHSYTFCPENETGCEIKPRFSSDAPGDTWIASVVLNGHLCRDEHVLIIIIENGTELHSASPHLFAVIHQWLESSFLWCWNQRMVGSVGLCWFKGSRD